MDITIREQAAAIMQARLSWPQADALAEDLDNAGLLRAALTDDAIVANAVQALRDAGWGKAKASDIGMHDRALTDIARTVLGSVAGE